MTLEINSTEGGASMQKHDASCRVAFLALGSIGDTIPLCALAASLPWTVNVVTHACHVSCLKGELNSVVKRWRVGEPINKGT